MLDGKYIDESSAIYCPYLLLGADLLLDVVDPAVELCRSVECYSSISQY